MMTDIIREKIQPRLDAFARKNGDSIRVEDLRWGIDTSKDNSTIVQTSRKLKIEKLFTHQLSQKALICMLSLQKKSISKNV